MVALQGSGRMPARWPTTVSSWGSEETLPKLTTTCAEPVAAEAVYTPLVLTTLWAAFNPNVVLESETISLVHSKVVPSSSQ
jgi:hypothetical protein